VPDTQEIRCLYCGRDFVFIQRRWEGATGPECPHCKETKNLRPLKNERDEIARDAFGYNYFPGQKRRL
jgi:DNA-directed RNA polymerase subunit RPC12/RpoP